MILTEILFGLQGAAGSDYSDRQSSWLGQPSGRLPPPRLDAPGLRRPARQCRLLCLSPERIPHELPNGVDWSGAWSEPRPMGHRAEVHLGRVLWAVLDRNRG